MRKYIALIFVDARQAFYAVHLVHNNMASDEAAARFSSKSYRFVELLLRAQGPGPGLGKVHVVGVFL